MQKSEATLFTKGYTLTCWWKHCYYDGRMSSSDNERIFLGNEIYVLRKSTKMPFAKKVGVRIVVDFKLSSADDKKTNKDTYVYINIFMINILYILSYYIIYLQYLLL